MGFGFHRFEISLGIIFLQLVVLRHRYNLYQILIHPAMMVLTLKIRKNTLQLPKTISIGFCLKILFVVRSPCSVLAVCSDSILFSTFRDGYRQGRGGMLLWASPAGAAPPVAEYSATCSWRAATSEPLISTFPDPHRHPPRASTFACLRKPSARITNNSCKHSASERRFFQSRCKVNES